MNSTPLSGDPHIDNLVARSYEYVSVDTLAHTRHSPRAEELAPLESSGKIQVSPIWQNPYENEGRLMQQYLRHNPEQDGLYVRQGLRDRLIIAARTLPPHVQLVVHAGYRPLTVQRQILAAFANEYRAQYPGASHSEALEHARLFVSDPDIKIPPHCCGAAVDVSLFDTKTNQALDMGSQINQDDELSYLHTKNISASQRGNRMLLLTTMLKAGFASYPTEWWHYSYGDPLWAWFCKQPAYLYGMTDLVTAS